MVEIKKLKDMIEKNYPLKVNRIYPEKDNNYKVETDQGYRQLIPIRAKGKKIKFIESLITTLQKKGFKQIPELYLTKENTSFVKDDYTNWILFEWISGKTPDIDSKEVVEKITRSLARLHQMTVEIDGDGKGKKEWTKWPKKLMEERREFYQYLMKVEKAGDLSDFDQMMVEKSEMIKRRLDLSKKWVFSLGSQNLINSERDNLAVTYHKMKEKELLVDLYGEIYFNNPVKMRYDIRVEDLITWIERLIKKVGKIHLIRDVVNWYSEERPLTRGEKEYLLSRLVYPKKVIKMVKRYHHDKKNWPEEGYVRKLSKALKRAEGEMKVYQELLKLFNELEEQ